MNDHFHVFLNVENVRVLVELVMQHGERNWSQIAKQLPGRVGKQCRERWNNHLRPNVKVTDRIYTYLIS